MVNMYYEGGESDQKDNSCPVEGVLSSDGKMINRESGRIGKMKVQVRVGIVPKRMHLLARVHNEAS